MTDLMKFPNDLREKSNNDLFEAIFGNFKAFGKE